MKLSKLRDEILKFLLKSYSENDNRTFSFDILVEKFSDSSEGRINDACISLSKDGLIHVVWADNVASIIFLDVQAIIANDEETWIKKGYNIFKEIRSWL